MYFKSLELITNAWILSSSSNNILLVVLPHPLPLPPRRRCLAPRLLYLPLRLLARTPCACQTLFLQRVFRPGLHALCGGVGGMAGTGGEDGEEGGGVGEGYKGRAEGWGGGANGSDVMMRANGNLRAGPAKVRTARHVNAALVAPLVDPLTRCTLCAPPTS
ncbi:unnamed protein product [Closterium sp. NIES-53]